MPETVVGGIPGYAASFFIGAGAELALSPMLTPRRMIVIAQTGRVGISGTPDSRHDQVAEALDN